MHRNMWSLLPIHRPYPRMLRKVLANRLGPCLVKFFNQGSCSHNATHENKGVLYNHVCSFCFTATNKTFPHTELKCRNPKENARGSQGMSHFDTRVHKEWRGHGGRVVTLLPPTSEARVRFPAWPQVGKVVVACRWSAVYSTEP